MVLRSAASRVLAGAGLVAGVALAPVAMAEKGGRPIFDPDALERAEKALKEIASSPYGKQVLDIARQQEVTKMQESKEHEQEHKRTTQQIIREMEHIRAQEERQLQEQRQQVNARMKQYEDELTRKRMMSDHELQRQRNAELVRLQEDAKLRGEQEKLRVEQQIQQERRSAQEYAAELQKQVEREKMLAEAEGRIRERRENEDIQRRAALLKYSEETKKALESINAVMGHLGNAARDLLTDQTKMITAVGGLTALALSFYGARESSRVIGRSVDRWLGTPRLVRETSRFNIYDPKTWTSSYRAKTYDEVKRDFSDIILPAHLHDNVRQQAAAAGNTKRHGAPFRHMLFYGPPGTGKTMAAKRLARTSGLDYAIMSGGDVAPLGGKAVSQLHELFDWAERSRRGLLLFIDEADAFLGKRTDEMSEGLRGSLNALLFRTGDQSRDFMVVLATNRPGDLDSAILDRMDEAMDFGLPGLEERKKILNLYLDKYISKAGTAEGEAGSGVATSIGARLSAMLRGRSSGAKRIEVTGINDKMLTEAAHATQGFSGRELAKFMASVQAAVYGSDSPTLSAEVFRSVLARKLKEHEERQMFKARRHGLSYSPMR